MGRLKEKGVEFTMVTLHVGYGTFSPVRVDDIRDHQIHSEFFSISPECADAVNRAKRDGRRVIAVGTTSVRTLEYAAQRCYCDQGRGQGMNGICSPFIHPKNGHIRPADTTKSERSQTVDHEFSSINTLRDVSIRFEGREGPRQWIESGSGMCDLFIYPGYRFKVVDAMITNFHLPESTLLMLISAFYEREQILSAYRKRLKSNIGFSVTAMPCL